MDPIYEAYKGSVNEGVNFSPLSYSNDVSVLQFKNGQVARMKNVKGNDFLVIYGSNPYANYDFDYQVELKWNPADGPPVQWYQETDTMAAARELAQKVADALAASGDPFKVAKKFMPKSGDGFTRVWFKNRAEFDDLKKRHGFK